MASHDGELRRAVIVAAGRSSRLFPLTKNTPKGLLPVAGEGMLARSVRLLRERGVDRIAVVVGCLRHRITEALAGESIDWIYNPFFAQTNNLGSLWFARSWVGDEPFLYQHSDIVYTPELLDRMLANGRSAPAQLLVDEGPADDEAMKVRVDAEGRFVESNKGIASSATHGEWVGMATFSTGVVEPLFVTLENVLADELFVAYDTEAFSRMAQGGVRFDLVETRGALWIEVDTPEDYARAQEIFPS